MRERPSRLRNSGSGGRWAIPSDSIWIGKRWSSTFLYMFDGLIYAALTAGAYAWLWPGAPGA